MNEWIIFFINWVLYSIDNFAMTYTATYLLTPKYSRLKTMLIWHGTVFITGTIKFFMPLYSKEDMIMGIINSVICITVSYLICKEGIFWCILAYGCINMICVLDSLIWYITPYAEATNWEIGTTIGYLISTPLLFIGYVLLVWGKRTLLGQKHFEIGGRIAILILLVATYYTMFSYVPIWLLVSVELSRETVTLLMQVVGIMVYVIILYMILKKSEEVRYFKRLKELELARVKEQDIYDGLVGRMEHMEKIRHDFYGQLAVARHIVSQDKSKGMQMLGELQEQLGSFYEEI